ncbi:MAG: hypothetical protein ABDH23_02970 [Endomicrobiia bacterium]
MKKVIYVLLLTIFFNSLYSETKLIPVINLSLLGGQNTFEGETSGFSGYLDANFSLGLRFSLSTTLLPILNLRYCGFKEVEELLGGGTLYQETLDSLLVIKLIHKLPYEFSVKPKIVLKHQAIKETKNETWENGLYNYTRSALGVEVSKDFNKRNILSSGINFSKIIFPNYTSLSYEAQETFGAEYSINAGTHPLDYNSIHFYIENEAKLTDKLTLKVSLNTNTKNFIEQNLVVDGPQYIEEKRKDQTVSLSFGISYLSTFFKNSASNIGIIFTLSSLNSNQNHFYIDPNYPKFIKDYYDYNSFKVTLPFSYIFMINEKPSILSVTLTSERKNYPQRPLQDENTGEFLEEKIYINYTNLSFSFEYKFTSNFSLKTIINLYASKSNMQYEKFYKYNYNGGYYLLGINYKY